MLGADEKPDHALWRALHTEYTLDDALYLRELLDVGLSRQHARAKNEATIRRIERSRS